MKKFLFTRLLTLVLVVDVFCVFDSIAGERVTDQWLREDTLTGDVNGDGSVTIKDVTNLIDFLLGDSTELVGGDVNGDGSVTIKDVTTLIDLLLADGSSPELADAPSILVLGNSYAQDSWSYVPYLLKEYGINIKLGLYFLGSGSLLQVKNGYERGSFPTSVNRGFYYFDTATDSTWSLRIPKTVVTLDGVDYCFPTPQQCVQYYEGMEDELAMVLTDTIGGYREKTGKLWDIIVLQQVSTGSVLWTTYYDNQTSVHYAKYIKDLVDQDMKKSYSLGWNITHSKSGNDADWPTDILDNIRDACSQSETDKTTNIGVVFPYGTAIFNARNDSILKTVGYNGYTNLWLDGWHLAGGLPHYLASLAIVEEIFRLYFPNSGLTVRGNSVIPNAEWLSGKSMPSFRATMIAGATAENCALAQEAAIRACDDPWNIYGGWPLTITISCNANCYIDSAPAEYGIARGATSATFQVARGTSISDIVIKAKEGFEFIDNSGNTQAYYRHKRGDGVIVYFAEPNESLGTEFTASIPGEQVVSNIEMFFNAK